jgi:mannose-6-phosphate isomerase-like protein (cupin superfamily)
MLAHAMTQLVELPPVDAGLAPHRHSGSVFGYVLEGRILFELEGDEPREIVAGEAFWEPGGDVVHYQVANLDSGNWSRVFCGVHLRSWRRHDHHARYRRRSRPAIICATQRPPTPE